MTDEHATSTGYKITEMTEGEVATMHESIAFNLRRAGLVGPALDRAIADAFLPAVQAIENDRIQDAERRARLKLAAVDGQTQ